MLTIPHQTRGAGTGIRGEPGRYPWFWTMPAIGVWIASVVVGIVRYPHLPPTLAIHYTAHGVANGWAPKSVGSAFAVVFIAGLTTVLIIGVSRLAFRSRPELDAEHPAASARPHRVRVRQMAMALLFLAACANVTTLVASLMVWDVVAPTGTIVLLGIGVPILVGVAGVTTVAVRAGRSGRGLPVDETQGDTDVVDRDDDRFWIAGLFYVNRDDPALLVDKRFGIGWTFNFGHPVAWLIMVLLVAVVLAPTFIHILAGR